MFRVGVIFGLAFIWGSPQFKDLRPYALDRPLVTFHYDVKDIARDAVSFVEAVDDARKLRFMDEYFDIVSDGLR